MFDKYNARSFNSLLDPVDVQAGYLSIREINMRHYEVVFLVNPGQSEQMPALVERYQGIITTDGGKVHRSEDWGRRQLAYPIQNFHKAHYWMFNLECTSDALGELTEAFRFNDHVMRHLVVRRDEAVTENSLLAQEKAKEDERKAKAAAVVVEPVVEAAPVKAEPAPAPAPAAPAASEEE